MSEVEPYTEEEIAAFADEVASGVGVMLSSEDAQSLLATIEAYKAEVEGARRARVSAEQDTAIMAHNLHTAYQRLEQLEAYITEEVGDPLPAPTGGE